MGSERRRVGIIVPPRYFDTTSRELTDLEPGIDVLHTQMRVDESFGFELAEIAACAEEIEACAKSLAAAGAEVVLQLGTPFSTVHGWEQANALRDRIEDAAGLPFEMMGLSVVQAVHALGAGSVALATGYYDQTWVRRYSDFVAASGLHITSDQSFTDQGHFATADDAFAASFDGFSDDLVVASIRQLAQDDQTADAILVPGMPGRILPLVPTLEDTIDRPIISYFAIWWKARVRLRLSPLADYGKLLATASSRKNL